MCSILFHTNWSNTWFCGIAQMHVLYNVLHALSHHQSNELLLRDRPDVCVVGCFTQPEAKSAWRLAFVGSFRCIFSLCFTRSEAMWGQRIATVGSPRWVFAIVFYTHWGKFRPTDCFCAIAQMHALCCVLHSLVGIAFVGSPRCTFCILLCKHWGNIRLTIFSCGIAQMCFTRT